MMSFSLCRSQEYTQKTLEEALDLQKNLQANYGGTEILQPLKAIYQKPLIPTHTRQVGWYFMYLILLLMQGPPVLVQRSLVLPCGAIYV